MKSAFAPEVGRRMRTAPARWLVPTALAIALAGCTVALIGSYDDTIDKGITGVQQQAELYFAKLKSAPGTPFNPAFHDSVASSLKVLQSRASALPKYEKIVEQISNLAGTFGTFRTLDSTSRRPISNAVVTNAETAVTVSIESILKLEIALKR